jgi:hypothetical protein
MRRVSEIRIEMVVNGERRVWLHRKNVDQMLNAPDSISGYLKKLRDECDQVRVFDEHPDRDTRGRKMEEAELRGETDE